MKLKTENKKKMLCIFGYVHFAGKRNDVNVKKQKHYNKLSNDYYYVTHAAEGVPFVFTNAAHDNLISQEMHNSRQFARFCWVYLQCCWPNENFYERFECGNYVLFICVVVENGKWNCIATKFSTKSDTIQIAIVFCTNTTKKSTKKPQNCTK